MFGAIPLPWKLAGAAVIIIALGAGALVIQHNAYADGYRQASAECAERARQQEQEIEQVKRDAEAEQDRLTDALRLLQEDNRNAQERIAEAAAADPHAADVCLDTGIMRDLSRIR